MQQRIRHLLSTETASFHVSHRAGDPLPRDRL